MGLSVHKPDPLYTCYAQRWARARMREDSDIDVLVVPDLPVVAALDPWQRTLWLSPGLAPDHFSGLLCDTSLACETLALDELRHFCYPPTPTTQALSSHVLIVPNRRKVA